MIHDAAFWLAILPPSLATLVELFNPINGRVVRASAERELAADFGGLSSTDREEILTTIEQTGAAVAEISGLAPTLVASTTSGFAIIHELSSPFWPAVTYVLIFVTISLYLLWLLSGLTFAQVDGRDAAIPLPLTRRSLRIPVRRATVVSLTIYFANIFLIGLAIWVFSGKEKDTLVQTLRPPAIYLNLANRDAEHSPTFDYWWNEILVQDLWLRMNELESQSALYKDEIAKFNERLRRESTSVIPASEFELSHKGWKRIQRSLLYRNHSPGPVDGIAGQQTRAAIREFQRAKGNGTLADGVLTTDQLGELW